MYNTWVIFTFVAVWHDLQLRLLIWGWLISLFILPEVAIGGFCHKRVRADVCFSPSYHVSRASLVLTHHASSWILPLSLSLSLQFGKRPWYRHLAALGGAFNILAMMTANLVGFSVGLDGLQELTKKFSQSTRTLH